MPVLYGKNYTKGELLERVGDISQVCSAVPVKRTDGSSEGVDAILFKTGSGLNFTVLPGRGMDISSADFEGKSLCWHSCTGETHPAFYEDGEPGWLRSFYGGLMVTCGLAKPVMRDGFCEKRFGSHGRVSNIPAGNVWVDGAWEGDDYRIWAVGKIREASVFGENLQLTRKISARLGESRIRIEDRVENLGFESVEHSILYHINIGFPILDAGSKLLIPSYRTIPRGEEDEMELADCLHFTAPQKGCREKVYFHKLFQNAQGFTKAALVNRGFENGRGFGVAISYTASTLGTLVEWKMQGQGHYVAGIEPSNITRFDEGRPEGKGRNRLLEPGESVEYGLEISVLPSNREIDEVEEEIRSYRQP